MPSLQMPSIGSNSSGSNSLLTVGLRGATTEKTARTAREASRDLEATFLSLLIKQMRETLDNDNGGLFPGDTGDVQGGLFDLFMSKHLADGGGLGLAEYVESVLTDKSVQKATPDATPRSLGTVSPSGSVP